MQHNTIPAQVIGIRAAVGDLSTLLLGLDIELIDRVEASDILTVIGENLNNIDELGDVVKAGLHASIDAVNAARSASACIIEQIENAAKEAKKDSERLDWLQGQTGGIDLRGLIDELRGLDK